MLYWRVVKRWWWSCSNVVLVTCVAIVMSISLLGPRHRPSPLEIVTHVYYKCLKFKDGDLEITRSQRELVFDLSLCWVKKWIIGNQPWCIPFTMFVTKICSGQPRRPQPNKEKGNDDWPRLAAGYSLALLRCSLSSLGCSISFTPFTRPFL